MVLPIIVGIGATMVALTAKSTIAAYRKFVLLTPQMIASLNNIKLTDSESDSRLDKTDPNYSHIRFLRSHYPNAPFKESMTEQEALLVLGIEGDEIMNFNKKMLRDRYRKLMILNHPDKNGSQYISQKINQAKEVLENSYIFKNER
ncbi:mitochondrial chaperonin of the DnaJ family [Scheffersomyces xylosifermentans]|uniref:mitochondrial chaperonin of the DnaJ family n=1 Tax=Scheffersomyces xylosifermentans TaxID=1304137 RepID=UPI00315DEB66